MANTILHKKSSTPAATPTTGQLTLGEIAVNTYDGKLFIKKNDGVESVVEIGGGGDIVIDAYANIVGGTGAGASVTATEVDNVFLGANSGNALNGGKENIMIGLQTGQYSTTVSYGVFVGKQAGRNVTGGFNPIAIGNQAMGVNSAGASGGYNAAVGAFSLADLTTGSYNNVLGYKAGDNITTGSFNLCLGNEAGPTTNVSNKLFIDKGPTDTPLIGGDFSTATVNIQGDLEVSGNVVSHIAINAQTGTSYTMLIGDDGHLITMNNVAANTLTIPANASVAYPIGTQILVTQTGAGTTSIAITSDTLVSAGGLTDLASQYSSATLIKIAATTWLLAGDLA